VPPLHRTTSRSHTIHGILQLLALNLVIVALMSSVGLLALDSTVPGAQGRFAAAIAALPLLAVGFSFVLVQLIIRPGRQELLKNLLLAATFVLWGCVQLMKLNLLSKTLGDVVIALYVTDLAWTIFESVLPARKSAK
jgi:hypothetical protein